MMTPTFTNEDFAALGAPALVYVRPIKASEALAGAPEGAFEEAQIDPEQTVFAVHGADGARLAVMTDRDSAYAVAVANDMAPVSVH